MLKQAKEMEKCQIVDAHIEGQRVFDNYNHTQWTTDQAEQLLIQLNACKEAQEWAADKTWTEVYSTCHRGDWLLWLFKKINPDDLKLLTLAKGHCANTVRHLMLDDRSIQAVDVAISFGEGKATLEELAAADSAYAAASAASFASAAASFASASASADSAYAANAVAYAEAAKKENQQLTAEKENQQLTADICRKYLPIEVWNINL